MKKHSFYLWAACCALALAACQKNAPENAVPDGEGVVFLQVTAPDAPEACVTKVAGGSTQDNNESKVNTLQVFIFRNNGATPAGNPIEADKYVSGTSSTTLNSLTGDKKIWAVVNAPRLYHVATEDALMKQVSLLKENTSTNLVMTGSQETTVLQYNNSSPTVGAITPVSISVNRLCARVGVHTVAADFTGTSLEGASLSIKEVYLINVVNSVRLDGTPRSVTELNTGSLWYNLTQLGNTADEALVNNTSKILKEGDLSLSVNTASASTGTDVNKYFYVYPNVSTVKSDDPSASARLTRLILHTYISGSTIEGHDSYYSLNIPVFGSGKTIERNHIYDISKITITNEGSPNPPPFPDMEFGKASASVTVGTWGGTETISYDL